MLSGEDLQVDAQRLRSRASEFDGLRERAERVAADLRDALADAGTSWGSDAVGRSFAAAHEPAAGRTGAGIDGLGGALQGVGDSFGSAAETYEAGDATAADAVTRSARVDGR